MKKNGDFSLRNVRYTIGWFLGYLVILTRSFYKVVFYEKMLVFLQWQIKAFFCSIKLRDILNIRKSPHCSTVYLNRWPLKSCRSFYSLYSIYTFILLALVITRYYCILMKFLPFLMTMIIHSSEMAHCKIMSSKTKY